MICDFFKCHPSQQQMTKCAVLAAAFFVAQIAFSTSAVFAAEKVVPITPSSVPENHTILAYPELGIYTGGIISVLFWAAELTRNKTDHRSYVIIKVYLCMLSFVSNTVGVLNTSNKLWRYSTTRGNLLSNVVQISALLQQWLGVAFLLAEHALLVYQKRLESFCPPTLLKFIFTFILPFFSNGAAYVQLVYAEHLIKFVKIGLSLPLLMATLAFGYIFDKAKRMELQSFIDKRPIRKNKKDIKAAAFFTVLIIGQSLISGLTELLCEFVSTPQLSLHLITIQYISSFTVAIVTAVVPFCFAHWKWGSCKNCVRVNNTVNPVSNNPPQPMNGSQNQGPVGETETYFKSLWRDWGTYSPH